MLGSIRVSHQGKQGCAANGVLRAELVGDNIAIAVGHTIKDNSPVLPPPVKALDLQAQPPSAPAFPVSNQLDRPTLTTTY